VSLQCSFGAVIHFCSGKGKVGGIWADVNSTSALQLNSLIYRFHPGVLWRHTYPSRDEIISGTFYLTAGTEIRTHVAVKKSVEFGRNTNSSLVRVSTYDPFHSLPTTV
jgi:hypothetical protein